MPRGIYKRKKNVKYGRPLKKLTAEQQLMDKANKLDDVKLHKFINGDGFFMDGNDRDSANKYYYRGIIGPPLEPSEAIAQADAAKTARVDNKILIHAKLAALESIINEIKSHMEAL